MILSIKKIRQETTRVSTFIFSPDAPLACRAGQHISMRLPHENPDNRGTIRSFSLSSSPTENYLSITTDQGESSFKKKLFSLTVGDTIEARGPGGGFILREEDPGQHIMIAGGIGITPFRSMLTYASDTHLSMPIRVLYSNRMPEEIIFRDYLDELTTKTHSIKIIITITRRERSSTVWNGRTGRIDEALIRECSTGRDRYYVCGSVPFVESMVVLLGTMGIGSDRVHYEKFTGYAN
jgi:ferredoxin-NADP reductase